MPRRVVFERNMRSQELTLANTGSDTARYSISIINVRMKEDGNVEVIDRPDSGQNFADKYLRLFPRSVTLGPNESQVIKLQLTKTGELQPGEYRSHLYFRAEPDARTFGVVNASKDSSISIQLVPVFGISIPVIIRVGETSVQVSLSDISLQPKENGTASLGFMIQRKGNQSVYGDLSIQFMPLKGKPVPVTTIKGIAVYTPNESRQVHLDLAKTNDVDYRSGTLQLVFASPADTKSEKYAEAVWQLH
ncbi:MAG: hypothetical protein INR73_15410 [Williamsia sp.]|nr:hypothetical protein [Williamsia sp.]